MFLPIRDFESVHYECTGYIICKTCYEEHLIDKLKIMYSLVISRTTLQALEIANLKTCHQCSKPIKYSPKRVVMVSESGCTASISLNGTAAVTHVPFPPSTNYANTMVLRSAHDALVTEARTFLQQALHEIYKVPVPHEFLFQAKHACRGEFFVKKRAAQRTIIPLPAAIEETPWQEDISAKPMQAVQPALDLRTMPDMQQMPMPRDSPSLHHLSNNVRTQHLRNLQIMPELQFAQTTDQTREDEKNQ